MKRILVTGANGQLGMTLQDLAPAYQEFNFYFTDKSVLDITRPEEVDKTFQEIKPEYCINCAAYTLVDQAEKTPEPAYAVNAQGVKHLVNACLEHNTTLIHISTDYVFEGTSEEGYSSSDTPNPINVYGQTKLEGELIIQKHLERFHIIRTSWLYSKKHGHNFYKTILAKAKEGQALTVTDQQKGCPTNAMNLATYILELLISDNQKYGIKHFTDGAAMTWYDFANKILINEGIRANTTLKRGENYRTFAARPAVSILLGDNHKV